MTSVTIILVSSGVFVVILSVPIYCKMNEKSDFIFHKRTPYYAKKHQNMFYGAWKIFTGLERHTGLISNVTTGHSGRTVSLNRVSGRMQQSSILVFLDPTVCLLRWADSSISHRTSYQGDSLCSLEWSISPRWPRASNLAPGHPVCVCASCLHAF